MCIKRLHDTALLILCCLAPGTAQTLYEAIESEVTFKGYDRGNITHRAKKAPSFLAEPGYPGNPAGEMRLFFSRVMAIAAPFILFRLKRSGFSGCRVTVTDGGLMVTASR